MKDQVIMDKLHSTIISILGSVVFVQAVAIIVMVALNRQDVHREAAPPVHTQVPAILSPNAPANSPACEPCEGSSSASTPQSFSQRSETCNANEMKRTKN